MSSFNKNSTISTSQFLEISSGSTYTQVGTLTNNNGIFSGFSSANYITTNGSISANSNNFVVFGYYRTGSDITTEQYIGCTLTRNLAIYIINSNAKKCKIKTNICLIFNKMTYIFAYLDKFFIKI